ncbi:cobyrinate a,c-diamide synthase [Thermosulfurimonas sp. F29]|uniref:cobyrinate a,c-diamide synthase n=1 Tax=Thermosulfurimonas sp. F29 TaxID=2867247 RepID=UPI001C83CEDF|nr:cobyrinate a,c-diamide synthase [Thermosulfurimonas sp. F29]MBX6423037.1 cobyrinate a,c-diamide synthase [Thermosulfurimonas sp. F29]
MNLSKVRGFVIAAPWSGAGKTVVACGLIRAFRRKGITVAPFKVGPDYIDPAYLERAAGRPCYNLDAWFCPGEALRRSMSRGMRGADLAVVEGVMGLFDGIGGTPRASTAEVARILELPVLIVLPAKSLSATAAALLKGLLEYDPELTFLGVILNGVGSARHERILRRAVSGLDLPVLGAIPREEILALPSRHLGLVQAEEMDLEERLEQWGETLIRRVDLDFVLYRACEKPLALPHPSSPLTPAVIPGKKVAVARDRAFSFYYRENLDLLEEAGAKILFFSPLRDPFPEEAEALYLGGGYPELFAEELSRRTDLRNTLLRRIKEGLPVLAECGGFMFLLEGIETGGTFYPMMGILPGVARMERRLRSLGYREVRFLRDSFLFPKGSLARGHEFRYSMVLKGELSGLEVRDAEGRTVETFGVVRENLVASYIHFHFGFLPEVVANFLV